jgi:uncharacterized repeat protein (TIGR01451 family)
MRCNLRLRSTSVLCWSFFISSVMAVFISTGCGSAAAPAVPAPVLSIVSSHVGSFSQGQQAGTYTVTVSNASAIGTGPTTATTVTVTDTVPSGLTLVSMAGTGWTCVNPTCTRTDVLAAAASFPAITVTANVAANAGTPLLNAASVTGGGSASAQTTDSTIVVEPVLIITKTHSGNFTQGQTGATYTIIVDNTTGLAPTSGTVTVTETVPSGLTLTLMAGTGWTCPGLGGANTCDRSDALATGASYQPITATVSVGAVAASPQVNAVAVSGGGATSANATDSTTIASSCPTGGDLTVLNGQYTFLMSGFDASGPLAEAGAFDADGLGHIAKTVGVADINSASGAPLTSTPIISASSSYTMGTDHRGCLVITTSAGTTTFRIAVGTLVTGVATKGRLIEFDGSGATGSGVLRKQTPSGFSSVSGHYAFGASSPEIGNTRFGLAGVFNLFGGVITSGSFDTNEIHLVSGSLQATVDNNGSTYPAAPLTLTSGTYTVSSTTGRGTLSLNVGGGMTVHIGVYAVSASELLMIGVDSQIGTNSSPPFTGSMLLQSGTLALNGSGVLQLTGSSFNGTSLAPDVLIGNFSNSGTTLTVSADENQAGTTAPQAFSATVTVDATTGRVTLAGGGTNPIFYLVTANEGFVLGTDNSVTAGFFEPQTTITLTPPQTFFFGTELPAAASVTDASGVVTLAAAGAETGTVDINTAATFNASQAFTGTYSSFDANGRATITGGGGADILYLISPTKAVLLQSTSTSPSIQVVEQ